LIVRFSSDRRLLVWKQLQMAEDSGPSTLTALAGSCTAGKLACSEPGMLRLVNRWLISEPFDEGGPAKLGSGLREQALFLVEHLVTAFPLVDPKTQRPMPSCGTNLAWGEDTTPTVWPAGVVPPDDAALAGELARRLVAAGVHHRLVILSHADCHRTFVNCSGLTIIGGIALEPSCRLALIQAGALPLLLAGVEANAGQPGDGRYLRRSCALVVELIAAGSEELLDPKYEQARLDALCTLKELLAVEYTTKEARVSGYTAGMAAKKVGNTHFKAREFQEALAQYKEALLTLPYMPCPDIFSEDTVISVAQNKMLKERATVLSNAAEVQLRLGDAKSALFFATCALWSADPSVEAKAACRRLRAVHQLLSQRSPTGERKFLWYPDTMAIDKAGYLAVPAQLVDELADDRSNAREIHAKMDKQLVGGTGVGWLGLPTGTMQIDGTAVDPQLLWVLVMCFDTNAAAKHIDSAVQREPPEELSLAIAYTHGFTNRFFSRRQHVVESVCASRVARRMGKHARSLPMTVFWGATRISNGALL
jgi:hypothetical protein